MAWGLRPPNKNTIKPSRGVVRGNRGNVLPKPGKFAKNGEQTRAQPVVSLDSKRKYKFSLIFKIVLKFFKLSQFSQNLSTF